MSLDAPPVVLLLLDLSLGYDRGVVQGVSRYTPRTGTRWRFQIVHYHSRNGSLNLGVQPDAIIGRLGGPQRVRSINRFSGPVVDITGHDLRFPTVATDESALARLAAAHFNERGLKHWAWIGYATPHIRSRQKAFRRLGVGSGIDVHEFSPPTDAALGSAKMQREMASWLKKLPMPIGLLAESDLNALDVVDAAYAARLRIPEDILLLGCDNDAQIAEMCNPPLSSIALPTRQIGKRAAALIDAQLERQPIPQEPIFISPTHIVTRKSTDLMATEDESMTRAAAFIRDHATELIHVEDIIRHVHLSRRALETR